MKINDVECNVYDSMYEFASEFNFDDYGPEIRDCHAEYIVSRVHMMDDHNFSIGDDVLDVGGVRYVPIDDFETGIRIYIPESCVDDDVYLVLGCGEQVEEEQWEFPYTGVVVFENEDAARNYITQHEQHRQLALVQQGYAIMCTSGENQDELIENYKKEANIPADEYVEIVDELEAQDGDLYIGVVSRAVLESESTIAIERDGVLRLCNELEE